MSQITQKTAVVNAVKQILGSSYDPTRSVSELLTSDQKKTVVDQVTQGIIDGDVAYNKDTGNANAVRTYVSGMVSNHIRKAKELNGGTTYSAQAKGRGSRDPKLSALRKLLDTYTPGSTEHQEIQEAITERRAELRASLPQRTESKKLNVDISDLPEDLQELANSL